MTPSRLPDGPEPLAPLAGERGTTPITAEVFRDVIGRFATGVTVITTIEDKEMYGTTASAVSSLSLEPPMLLVCMNRESLTGRAITRVGAFAVNILAESQDWLARQFARKDGGKFTDVVLLTGRGGQPLIDGSLAHLECRVVDQMSAGTHVVLLAEVDEASAQAGSPLAYFRGQFGRLSLGLEEQAQ
jgi:flavin reductase (DIM6/NTAB) family NADH-FMN oxidoreductase RutF